MIKIIFNEIFIVLFNYIFFLLKLFFFNKKYGFDMIIVNYGK